MTRSAPHLAALALLLGCGGPSRGPTDAAPPRDTADAVEASPHDAALSDSLAPDVPLVVPDFGAVDLPAGDALLADTPLADVALLRPAALTLCSVWEPGRSFEEIAARRVRIALPPADAVRLAPDDLGALSVADVAVARGPLAAARWRPPREALAAEVVRWEVEGDATSARLRATVVHALGVAGWLVHTLDVTRATGDARPVVADGTAPELQLGWLPPEGGAAVPLAPCVVAPTLDDAAAVLVATGDDGDAAVLRFGPALAESGAPVPSAAVRFFDAHIGWSYDAFGLWAQTYAAAPRGGRERLRIDFAGDSAFWFSTFASDGLPGYALPATVDVETNGTSGGGGLTVAWTGSAAGDLPVTRTFPIDGGWRRVDAAGLRPLLDGRCTDGTILGCGGYRGTVLQVFVCEEPGGPRRVLGVVPVLYAPDVRAAGVPVWEVEAATSFGQPVSRVAIGGAFVELSDTGQPYLAYTLRDAAGESLDSGSCGEGVLVPLPIEELTVRAANAAAGVRVEVTYAGGGDGSLPVAIALTFGGETHVADAWDRLSAFADHHACTRSVTGRTENLVLEWVHVQGDPWMCGIDTNSQVVRARALDGAVVLPDTVVVPEE